MATNLIVCGLGNPGPRYSNTRHNLGFWTVDLLCERFGGKWRQPSGRYVEGHVEIAGKPVLLVEPLTYMNLSGRALRSLFPSGEIEPAGLLVVCDDTAIPLGRLRLRKRGSAGGHNGLNSIIESFQTKDFARLRLGAGPVPENVDQADFVLSAISAQDVVTARDMVDRAVSCVETWVSAGIETAMNRFNSRGENGEVAPEQTD